MKTARCLGFLAVFACVHAARALIVYDSAGSTDNNLNNITTGSAAPGNGAPWQYVAEVTNADVSTDASAVYLGNDFLITANHVNLSTSVLLNGASYSIDNTYTPLQLGLADLKLFKIIGDPGLAQLQLTGVLDNDLGMSTTMVGWGVGKGSVIAGEGWTWGDDSTRAQRWGSNVTLSTLALSDGVLYLQTAFDPTLGANVASASLGDSGSALFQEFSGTWKLAGVYVGVDTPGASYYAGSPNNLSGMDYSYAIEMKPYSDTIIAAIPEPGSVALMGIGAAALVWLARRRRSNHIRPRSL